METATSKLFEIEAGQCLETTDPDLLVFAVMSGVPGRREVTLWTPGDGGRHLFYGSIPLQQILAPKGSSLYWDGHLHGSAALKEATLNDFDRILLSNWAQSEALGYEESWEQL